LLAQFLIDYGLFISKTITLLIAFIIAAGALFTIIRSNRSQPAEHLKIRKLNKRYEIIQGDLNAKLLNKAQLRQAKKSKKLKNKQLAKTARQSGQLRKRVFVLDFHGDIRASAVENLREEITAILAVANPQDEVFLRLESSGGMVHSYGLAASQLQRLRDRKLTLTVSVDKVAASGGYMMACVANRIIAAPFAIVGSIGVVAELPNFHRWLKQHDVDFELHTAGEYKRTLTIFGENTDQGRQKFREDLERTHGLFKQLVQGHRPHLNLQMIATGEHWYGLQALDLNLVDELKVSDDYLCELLCSADIYELHHHRRQTLQKRMAAGASLMLETVVKYAQTQEQEVGINKS